MIYNVELLRSVWAVLVLLTLIPSALSLALHVSTWRGMRGLFWWWITLDLLGFVAVLGTVLLSLWWNPRPVWFDWGRIVLFLLVVVAVYWRLGLQIRALIKGGRHAERASGR